MKDTDGYITVRETDYGMDGFSVRLHIYTRRGKTDDHLVLVYGADSYLDF